jgi:hypothetical protein
MAFGFEVKNATGNVIIDTTYQNLSLALKQDFNIASGATFDVTYSGAVAPLMCINSSGSLGYYRTTFSGSTYTWRFKSSEAASGSIYIFDKPHPAHVSSFGLKVLASDGVTEVFNSDNKYLRVVDLLSIPWTATFSAQLGDRVYGAAASKTGLTSSKYAVALVTPRVDTTGVSNNNFNRVFDGVKTTATSVTVAQTIPLTFFAGGNNDNPGFFANSGSGTINALVVCVEGF